MIVEQCQRYIPDGLVLDLATRLSISYPSALSILQELDTHGLTIDLSQGGDHV